jgi:hypothetical protein
MAMQAQTQITDVPEARRYEMRLDGELIGILDYVEHDAHRVLAYVEVEPRFGGNGLGGRLTEAALNDCRERGFTVTPECPFIVRYIREHPEHRDIVAGRS